MSFALSEKANKYRFAFGNVYTAIVKPLRTIPVKKEERFVGLFNNGLVVEVKGMPLHFIKSFCKCDVVEYSFDSEIMNAVEDEIFINITEPRKILMAKVNKENGSQWYEKTWRSSWVTGFFYSDETLLSEGWIRKFENYFQMVLLVDNYIDVNALIFISQDKSYRFSSSRYDEYIVYEYDGHGNFDIVNISVDERNINK